MFNDQTLNGQWGDGAADGGNQPQQPALVEPPQQPAPMPEAQHIQALLEAVVAIGAGQRAFMDNQARYGLALESMTRHLDNLGQATAQGSAQAPTQRSRAIKTCDPRMFNGRVSEVVSFLREIRAYIDLQQVPTDRQKAMLLSMYLKDGSPISSESTISRPYSYGAVACSGQIFPYSPLRSA
ncbi:hypothetical protein C8Q72DRAFT_825861 [Fomitopsis betulina]|nr:hypothetical protein C8Q72DRAFT_825861 [Fomitopsis betulina]